MEKRKKLKKTSKWTGGMAQAVQQSPEPPKKKKKEYVNKTGLVLVLDPRKLLALKCWFCFTLFGRK
jgi:hypothetical protein